jgi:osmotically-inducible protein OsmY
MRSDSEIKTDVEDELLWDRAIDASYITVAVHNGVVTLTGFVRSYMQKTRAERDAKRVAGTLGVANDIEVRLPLINKRPDPEIAHNAVEKLHDALPDPSELIKLTVKAGWLTLEGDIEWNSQRDQAIQAVQAVRGVVGVSDNLKVKPRVAASDVKRQVEAALKRSAELDANCITVETSDSTVTLKGSVRSWAERTEVERAAWQAPGITTVENQISISP